MTYPKISIVTPSYNQAEFIEETLVSVISQGYPNLEYIVIDGGSTDGSVDIIKKYEKYLAYWVSEPDNGHADALNKGFSRATGEIMAWINSDDKYYSWTFTTVAEVFNAHQDINWIVGLYSNYDRKGRLTSVRSEYRNVYSYIFGDFHIQQESVFWRRPLWEKTGSYIDTSVNLMIDTELWCRFFLYDELWHIDRVLGGYRSWGLNRSHVFKEDVEKDLNICISKLETTLPDEKKKLLNEIKEFQAYYSYYYKVVGSTSEKIRKNRLFRTLPFFLYDKFCNLIYRLKMEKYRLKVPQIPVHESLVIKRLIYENDQWIKDTLAYQVPY